MAVVIGLLGHWAIRRVRGAALPFALLLPGTVSLTLWYPVSLFILSTLRRPGTTTAIQGAALIAGLPLYYVAIVEWEMTGAALASSVVYISVLTMGLCVLLRNSRLRVRDLLPGGVELRRLAELSRSAVWRGARA